MSKLSNALNAVLAVKNEIRALKGLPPSDLTVQLVQEELDQQVPQLREAVTQVGLEAMDGLIRSTFNSLVGAGVEEVLSKDRSLHRDKVEALIQRAMTASADYFVLRLSA